MKLEKGVEIEAPNEEPRMWRVKIPVGDTFLVFRLGADSIQLDLGKTPFDARRRVRGAAFTNALREAGLWFQELGERNRDTRAARESNGNDDE